MISFNLEDKVGLLDYGKNHNLDYLVKNDYPFTLKTSIYLKKKCEQYVFNSWLPWTLSIIQLKNQ